ncbi:PAAR-like domain-containing protein [Archangium sp.]|uniref:PAAR-like domain-containing protein n=1 Tax=Archangium sp. TaxID=1872627 RepID=UPI002D624CA1|nr:PAAR-like domain-containing protein [Archangium sp.]HYO53650.1 PAAR-like domain-containing protein [Archangium sp.]
MSVTVNVNGLSLCHEQSGGLTIATVPDVCKTPSPGGPVPIPYPNISRSADLGKGTKSVSADGGNSIAVKGSEFSRSQGDEPGSAGGVKSGVNMKEAKWLSYSFDVKMEGKNVCRLTDKMLCNHGNTVCLGGILQEFLQILETQGDKKALCLILCHCDKNPVKVKTSGEDRKSDGKQECVKQTLDALDTPPGNSRFKAEVSYDIAQKPPKPFMHRDEKGHDMLERSKHWQTRARKEIEGYKPGSENDGKYMVRIPDVVVVKDASRPPYQDNLKAVVEMKFDEPRDEQQIKDYKKIAGKKAEVWELNTQECGCRDKKPKTREVPVPVPAREPAKEQVKIKDIALGTGAVIVGAVAVVALVLDDALPTGVTQADDAAIPAAGALMRWGVQRLMLAF